MHRFPPPPLQAPPSSTGSLPFSHTGVWRSKKALKFNDFSASSQMAWFCTFQLFHTRVGLPSAGLLRASHFIELLWKLCSPHAEVYNYTSHGELCN